MAFYGSSSTELSVSRASRWSLVACVCAVVLSTVATAQAAQTPTYKKIAVLMFKAQNYGSTWVDATTVRNTVWLNAKSSSAFYLEESFGKWALGSALSTSGDVFGWYTVPYNDDGHCVQSTWSTSAKAMAAQAGFVEANYDALIYVTKATGCPGRAWTSGKVVTVTSGFDAPTISHELGHAFGLAHASSWSCKDSLGVKVSISSSCTVTEYGDFPVMGATTSYHMNVFHKGALGWLASGNTKDVTADGVYSLYPVEQPTSYAQTIRIPRKYVNNSPSDYYYLEFRQPYGFDDFSASNAKATGISIRVAPSYVYKGSHSYLLDATTPAITSFTDAQLKVGSTFTDPTRKVSITLLSTVGGVAQVLVDFF